MGERLSAFRFTVTLCIFLIVACFPCLTAFGSDLTDTAANYEKILDSSYSNVPDYKKYMQRLGEKPKPDTEYVIEAEQYIRVHGMNVKKYTDFEGMEGVSIYTGEQGFIEYEVNIRQEGLYSLSVLYYPVEGKNASIQRSVFIDGDLPYKQLGLVEFSRIWVNADNEWETDNRGNDLKPRQIEAPMWIKSYCYDSEGYETEKLCIYLDKGVHTITFYSLREPMIIRRVFLDNPEQTKQYREVKAEYDSMGASDTENQLITIHAEKADRKSSQMLYPSQDKSSPAVFPYSVKELKNNTIGSNNNWRIIGQWIEWDFFVEKSGYYYITFHQRQNFVRGIYTSRKIMIDGDVPFKEVSAYGFPYKSRWHLATLQDSKGDKYRFYLEEGKHTLRMEVVLGDFAEIINDVQDAVLSINSVYRKIIRITGVQPDKYRDYHIEKNIPGLTDELIPIKEKLEEAVVKLRNVAGTGSDREAALNTMIRQLNYLIKDVERFPVILPAFKVDMSALGNWITSVMDQPLALDTIYIHSPNVNIPKTNDSLLSRIFHTIKTLYYSFVIDYNAIGNIADRNDTDTITVWIGPSRDQASNAVLVGSGRDQANVVKALIDERFTPETGINVNLQLVDMSMLLQATLAGQGPDVAIQVANDLPMNYGMRSAVVDLSEFKDLPEVKAAFRKSALVPYEFGGHTFALPETETCLMMFYRKDILDELGLEIPVTWDEMKAAFSVLAKNQMDLGMLPTEQVFAMFLYQYGGEYYNEDATRSALDSDIAIRAFKECCEYYTDYKLEREAPVDQRFRTGEAPIVISDFTLYNQLQVSAPDIKGLWGFAMVPGTVRDDGTMDHSVSSTGTAAIIMNQTKNRNASWEFLKWWVSTDIQSQYGNEMEAVLGPSARYPAANIEAFNKLPWPTRDFNTLMNQFDWIKGIPQVPGGYFSWRNVNNAFYRVVIAESEQRKQQMQPREALMEYVRYINEEITFKRKEFGLPFAEK
ncbi:MAG: extracellular solute-binding protein [Bacillota bacterium]|nr:extracellular solute-binding protein [Bacillota bacterium]